MPRLRLKRIADQRRRREVRIHSLVEGESFVAASFFPLGKRSRECRTPGFGWFFSLSSGLKAAIVANAAVRVRRKV
jgi:hypothetical protein